MRFRPAIGLALAAAAAAVVACGSSGHDSTTDNPRSTSDAAADVGADVESMSHGDASAPPVDGGGKTAEGSAQVADTGSTAETSTQMAGQPAQIVMISGTGASLLEGWPGGLLKLKVIDSLGNGVPNVLVTWSLLSGDGANFSSPGSPTDMTDANGEASRNANGESFNSTEPFGQAVIQATCVVGSVDFDTVTVHEGSSGPIAALIVITAPDSIDFGDVKAGSVISAGVQMSAAIQSGAYSGMGLPGVALRMASTADNDLPGAAGCVGGTVFSSASGVASCDVQVGMTMGDQYLSIIGGEQTIFGPYHLNVTP